MRVRHHAHRNAFTLVELLAVVGIIALLIGILVPSVTNAQRQARKAKTMKLVKSISEALEVFHNDFKEYPDSTYRIDANNLKLDPITDLPDGQGGTLPQVALSGSHWLARAMAGPDLQGIDTAGKVLQDGNQVQLSTDHLKDLSRKSPYLQDTELFVRDTNAFTFNMDGSPRTGRPVIVDTLNYPILYYRANPKRKKPFSRNMFDPDTIGGVARLGVYNHEDNILMTGTDADPNQIGWHFASAKDHNLRPFGPHGYHSDNQNCDNSPDSRPPNCPNDNLHTFVGQLHNHDVHQMSEQVKPINPETYILMSAGQDGIYGTEDDVANYKVGL